MTEKTKSDYLKEAVKHIKKIYKKLGHSPTAAEYDEIAELQFKLRALYKYDIKLNQLKEVAGIPKKKSGFKAGQHKGNRRPYIFCIAYKGKIAATECMPGYREESCRNCKSKQKNNVKAIPDIPEEIEQSLKYDICAGNKYLNGNGIHMTDVSII